jgi:general nucleoside transport system permease protein
MAPAMVEEAATGLTTKGRTIAVASRRLAGGVAVEALLIPVGAFVGALVLFGIFVAFAGVNPFAVYGTIVKGAVGSLFAIQNTLTLAAPLILTGLCTALPAQVGLMIIGGEGAFVVGGLCATAVGVALPGAAPLVVQLAMAAAGIAAGGLWIGSAGALRHWRGVNETISSLLLNYIAIAILNQLVEGPFRNPASLNKPSSPSIPYADMIGNIPGTEIHWGLVIGMAVAMLAYVLIRHTAIGFAARIAGGNPRAARMVGLPIGKLVLLTCFLGGGAAGLSGMIEVAAVQQSASADLVTGYGYTGILVAFLARQNPLAIIPVSVLLGGIGASGGLLQQRLGLPDAATVVLQGIIFVCILASDTLYGRVPWLSGREV